MIRYENIAAAIQVRHLQVEIEEAVSFERDTAADEAARALADRGFDQAPVVEGGGVVGLVRGAALVGPARRVGDAAEEIRADMLVSADAPVAQALGWLQESPCLFVLEGRRVSGFFVVADLNKQPARTYFYLLVASLEGGLARLIREWAGGDEARLTAVKAGQVWGRARRARAEAQEFDADADLVSYLLFSDILRVVGAIPEIRGRFGARSARAWSKRTGSLVGLRNAVMHPTSELVGHGRSLERLIELEAMLRELLEQLDAAGSSPNGDGRPRDATKGQAVRRPDRASNPQAEQPA